MTDTPNPSAKSNEAGKWESLFIQLIANSFDDRILTLAEKWDQMPGLTPKQQAGLRKVSFFRTHIEAIAYIKQHKRISENTLPAAPLESFLTKALKYMRPSSAISEQTWLTALGLGDFKVKVAEGVMAIDTPLALQKLGVTQRLTAKAPGVTLKVPSHHDGSATKPYIKVNLVLGPFEIALKGSEVLKSGDDRGKVKTTFSIEQGTKLGKAALCYKWDGKVLGATGASEKVLEMDFSPQLNETLAGGLYFKIDGKRLRFDRAYLTGLKLKPETPKLPLALKLLQQHVEQLFYSLEHTLQEALAKLDFGRLLEPCLSKGHTLLCKTLGTEAVGQDGVVAVDAVERLNVDKEATLGAEVKVTCYEGPTPSENDLSAFKKSYAKYNKGQLQQ